MTTTHPALQSSHVAALYRRRRAVLESAWRSSNANAVVQRMDHSQNANWLTRATVYSFLYRWLTAELDPEVIVIDLRETYTVGPVIAMGIRATIVLAPIWRTSRIKRAADGIVSFLEFAARSKTGQLITAFLERPEQSENRE